MTKWTAPDIASIRGDNSRPLQKIFGSLTEYLKDYQDTIDTSSSSSSQTFVRNGEATTLTIGTVVYLDAQQGDRATVKRAFNTSDATSAKTLGVVAESIAPSADGLVTTLGYLEKVNTSAFTAGQTLYLGATAGTFTATKPVAPNHMVYVGVVVRANAGNGIIYVRCQNGYELDEIHDVLITSPTAGQTLSYDAVNSLWKNATFSDGGGLTNLNASNLASGTVPTGRMTGSYTGITGIGTLTVGSIPATLLTGTVASARISGSYTGITGVGTLSAGSIPASLLTGTIANARLPTAINISSTMQAYSYQGNANVAGTGNASYHPSGIYSTGTNWLYGQMYMNNGSLGDASSSTNGANQIYASGWFRSWGDSGWYNQSYGGGVYMVDTTFVRIYNSKIFYAAGGIWSVDGGTASTSGFQYLLRGATYGNYAPFTSMREAKRNIETISNSGLLIDQLNPVTFQEQLTDQDDKVSTAWKDADLEYGFIADEVAQVGTGHLAQYKGMDDGTLKPVGWSFHGVVSVLVAEVKDLRSRLKALEGAK